MNTSDSNITDLISPQALRQLLRHFSAATGYGVEIQDAEGRTLATMDAPDGYTRAVAALQADVAAYGANLPPVAPVQVDGRSIASIILKMNGTDCEPTGERTGAPGLLFLLADTLGQMCHQGFRAERYLEGLTTLFEISTMLSGERNLHRVLKTTVRAVVELMNVKASAIRLLDSDGDLLVTEAVHNLSSKYLEKGTIRLSESLIDQKALAGELVYIENMATSPSVLYPEDAKREGLASILSVGMIYRGHAVGVMRIYTAEVQQFSATQRNLLRALAQLAAAAIRNVDLDEQHREHQRIQREVELASDVQRRLLPDRDPDFPPFDVAGVFDPCFEIGGDFYDFIPLKDSLGVVLGDVVGKGVGAGLLMASVRSSLRAHAEDVGDLDEVMSRVNRTLVRDSKPEEFATVFYGMIDSTNNRLTYCSAGHEPAILYKQGMFDELVTGGMAIGIDEGQQYAKRGVDMGGGDILVLYSDGVTDATNFDGERFGREKVRQAIEEAAERSARDILNHILWQIRRFVGLNPRPDDITLVAVKVPENA